MPTSDPPIRIGDFVRLRAPRVLPDEYPARGRVYAVNTWRDAHGTKIDYHVMWFDPDGTPGQESKHPSQHLELFPTA